jgi:hypothetical protein
MAVCLYFFPPTVKLKTYLDGYISCHMKTDDDLPDLIVSQADDYHPFYKISMKNTRPRIKLQSSNGF